jgi:predicted  nucleic acid-binding Zn-ribbon protein
MKRVVVAMLALSVCVSAFGAKIFKWVDDKGHVQYTNAPPPEATMDKVQKTFDYVPPSPEEKALAAARAAADAQQAEDAQARAKVVAGLEKRDSQMAQEVQALSDREAQLTRELDNERTEPAHSLANDINKATKIRRVQNELESVRRQMRALLGHESPAADADERLSKLEKRVARAERKPAVEDFTLNGSQCQRVDTDIRCIRF